MQKTLKWTPAQPQRKPDNIISSKARETGDVTGFIPSYLSEPAEDMGLIMSNEYMRKWFKERGSYEKDTYSKEQIIKEESKIKRRFVQRMMTYRKPNKNQLLEEKFLKKSPEQQKVDYTKFKYKPVCPKTTAKTKPPPISKLTPNAQQKSENDNDKTTGQPIIFCQLPQNCNC